jgi:NADH pyrophosphatase NudC (nudix superfamily)
MKKCEWKDEGEYWQTECDNAHEFTTGGPVENRHRFCPYCGKEIEVKTRICDISVYYCGTAGNNGYNQML